MAKAQRSTDIAKERGMALKQILSHDLLSSSPLFDGDLPAHVNKSKLIGEIEPGPHQIESGVHSCHSCYRRFHVKDAADATCTIIYSG